MFDNSTASGSLMSSFDVDPTTGAIRSFSGSGDVSLNNEFVLIEVTHRLDFSFDIIDDATVLDFDFLLNESDERIENNASLRIERSSPGGGSDVILNSVAQNTTLEFPAGRNYTLSLFVGSGIESVPGAFITSFDFSATFADDATSPTNFHWDNAAGGSFGNSDNWLEDQFPDAINETALFDLNGNYTVTFPSGFENDSAVVSAGNVTFDLQGNTYLLNSGVDTGLTVETTGAELTVTNGNVNATKVNVLDHATLNITGASNVQAANDIRVSGPLASILNINGGAEASTTGDLFLGGASGNGVLVLDNATFTGFNNLIAAGSLSGFNAQNGATAAFANQLSLSSDASAIIDGGGTFVGAKQLFTVSNSRFEVTSGANADFISAQINGPADPPMTPLPAHLVATGANSKVKITGALDTGHSNAADVLIDDNATLEVGSLDHRGGNITVSNLASLTVDGHVRIASDTDLAGVTIQSGGFFSADSLTLDNLSVFQLSGAAPMNPEGGSSVIVTNAINVLGFSVMDISSGAVLGAGAMTIGDASGVNVTGENTKLIVFESISVAGNLDVNDNAKVTADGLIVDSTGSVTGNNGTIEVSNIINDQGGFINNGLLSGGNSPGIFTIVGDYLQPDPGALLIEIAGLTPGAQYDQIFVDGDATIEGNVIFKFIDGFLPTAGEVYDFLNVNGVADLSSASYEIQGLAHGWEFDIAFSAGGYQLVSLSDARAIPEPTSVVMVMAFAAAAANVSRSRKI